VSKQTRTIVVTVAVTLLAIAVVQNFRGVVVQFVVWRFAMPLTVVVLLSGLAGACAGWFWRRR
jgi:uncharacterized integral membrane protein